MSQKHLIQGVAVIAAVVVVGVFFYLLPMQTKTDMDSGTQAFGNEAPAQGESSVGANGLVIRDDVVGTGAEATAGALLTVNYVGTLSNGTKFDSSYDRNQPFQFKLGEGRVIKGWEQGFAGMRVGGKRTLVIPPELGYGAQGIGPIPPNATLVFEVELLEVSK